MSGQFPPVADQGCLEAVEEGALRIGAVAARAPGGGAADLDPAHAGREILRLGKLRGRDIETHGFSSFWQWSHVDQLGGIEPRIFLFQKRVILRPPVVGDVIVTVPAEASVGSVERLEGDHLGRIGGVERDVRVKPGDLLGQWRR